jgi:hypothetical protein
VWPAAHWSYAFPMAVHGDWQLLVSGSVAVIVLRPRCSVGGEFFCFLLSSSAVAYVGGERDLVVARMYLYI